MRPLITFLLLALVRGAIDAALDVHSSFTVGTNNYPALPDSAGTRFGLWDMGALEKNTGNLRRLY